MKCERAKIKLEKNQIFYLTGTSISINGLCKSGYGFTPNKLISIPKSAEIILADILSGGIWHLRYFDFSKKIESVGEHLKSILTFQYESNSPIHIPLGDYLNYLKTRYVFNSI